MSTIFVLFIETILLLCYFNVIRARYIPNNGVLAHERQATKIADVFWPDTSFIQDSPTLDRNKNSPKFADKHWEIKDNDRFELDNDLTNYEKAKETSKTRLAVRNRLAWTIKDVLEEMVILVTDDIEKTNRALSALSQEPRNNENDSSNEKSLEAIYDETLMKAEPDLTTDERLVAGFHKMQKNEKNFQPNTPAISTIYHSRPRRRDDYHVNLNLKEPKT